MDAKIPKRILVLEASGFLLLAAFVWASELFDLPHRWLGAPDTPVNLREALAATLLLLALGSVQIEFTRRLLRRLNRLEGILPICSGCKKIRDEAGDWQGIEGYVRDHSQVDFSHGLCPDCLARLYPEFAEAPPSPPASDLR